MVVAIIIAAVVIIGVVVLLISSRTATPSRATQEEAVGEFRLAPPVVEFHVKGEEALVTFAVPVPEGEPDEVLKQLLTHEAVEVVREKSHELPMDQVHRVVVYGQRSGSPVELGRVDLETPGQLPPPVVPDLIPHASAVGFDPLQAMGGAPSAAPGLADVVKEGELPPLASEIRLTSAGEAGLRAQGLDPGTLGAGDLGLGLMRMAGYAVTTQSPGSFTATKAGKSTFVRVVEHASGDYPVLEDSTINQFVVDFVQSGTSSGLLFTEKFCPFEVYERERREPRIRFVSRERFQSFVDAFSIASGSA